ncbi:tetratricopeptide repeat protein [Bacteroides oleiciplenus]|uniref:Tetratricopeptide repeat protein n=2 Tax=Bacteroides oleiciplenus TaxID=626931 RepID=A0A3E5BKP2_9BACE|nr:tetratricopeptide repeat protein [Bacteroides oleiciplenus]
MKYIINILVIVVMTGCIGTSQSNQQSAADSHAIDSLAFMCKERGNVKDDAGDKQGAIEDYTKAIEINPNYVTAYYNRAIVKSSMGNKKGAIKDYTKVIELDSLKSGAYYGRGNARAFLGDKKGGIADLTKVIELDPKDVDAYVNRGVMKCEIGDFEGEISDYRLAIKNHCKPDANLYNNLGRALYDLERFKESAEAYGEGIKYFPKDYRLYYGRGLARKRTGDKRGACEDWMKSSELGCIQANMLLPLCEEYIKEKNDSLKREKETANKIE